MGSQSFLELKYKELSKVLLADVPVDHVCSPGHRQKELFFIDCTGQHPTAYIGYPALPKHSIPALVFSVMLGGYNTRVNEGYQFVTPAELSRVVSNQMEKLNPSRIS